MERRYTWSLDALRSKRQQTFAPTTACPNAAAEKYHPSQKGSSDLRYPSLQVELAHRS